MKESTKLVLAFIGSGAVSALALGAPVAEATENFSGVAAGGEGLLALGGGYWAYKKKSLAGAIVGGIAAGLLVETVRAGLMAKQDSAQGPVPPVPSVPVAGATAAATSGAARAMAIELGFPPDGPWTPAQIEEIKALAAKMRALADGSTSNQSQEIPSVFAGWEKVSR